MEEGGDGRGRRPERREREREAQKKSILKNGLAVLVEKGFLSFIVSHPGSGVPP